MSYPDTNTPIHKTYNKLQQSSLNLCMKFHRARLTRFIKAQLLLIKNGNIKTDIDPT